MTEEQAEKKARESGKKPSFIFRLGTAWDAAWGWVSKGDAKWKHFKDGKLKHDKRTVRRVA